MDKSETSSWKNQHCRESSLTKQNSKRDRCLYLIGYRTLKLERHVTCTSILKIVHVRIRTHRIRKTPRFTLLNSQSLGTNTSGNGDQKKTFLDLGTTWKRKNFHIRNVPGKKVQSRFLRCFSRRPLQDILGNLSSHLRRYKIQPQTNALRLRKALWWNERTQNQVPRRKNPR